MTYFLIASCTMVLFIYLVKVFAKGWHAQDKSGIRENLGEYADDLNDNVIAFVCLSVILGLAWPLTLFLVAVIGIIYLFEKVVGI